MKAYAILAVTAMVATAGSWHRLQAAVVVDQVTDINNGGLDFGQVNAFSNPPLGIDDTAVYMGNDVVVYSLTGPTAADGAGLSTGISNGENGITLTEGGLNVDIDNETPADSVFSDIGNASGKLENGNAIRFSMWMRQDPASPVVKEPSVEPVVKIELWKEALSDNGDFSAVPFPGGGDRIWDTDQNASNVIFDGSDQSQASWVDMNNNGVIANGVQEFTSLVTDEWRLIETTLVVDDDPLDDGAGWSIGTEFFDVTAVEEIRGVMFVGDFVETDLTDGGSFFVDNMMLEVFADEATMLATPNPNTAPVEVEGLPGDYNDNGVVDAADYTVWRDNLGSDVALENDDTAGVGADDYTRWKTNFGMTIGGGAAQLGASAVPEPMAIALVLVGLLASSSLLSSRTRREAPMRCAELV